MFSLFLTVVNLFVFIHPENPNLLIAVCMYNYTKAPFWMMLMVWKTLSSCGLRRLSGVAGWLTGRTASACFAADI
jgi:hypothetical protein